MTLCTGCDKPVWEAHKTIEEHLACEAAQAAKVLAELDEANKNVLTRRQKVLRQNKRERKA